MDDISLSKALKAMRLFNRFSQHQLAEQLGVGKSFISDIERGNKTVTLKLVDRYSETFKVPRSDIFALAEAYEQREFRSGVSEFILKVIDWVTTDETGVSKSKGVYLEQNMDSVDLPPAGITTLERTLSTDEKASVRNDVDKDPPTGMAVNLANS